MRGGFINTPGTQTLQQTLVRLKARPKYSRSESDTASEISTLQILLCDHCCKKITDVYRFSSLVSQSAG